MVLKTYILSLLCPSNPGDSSWPLLNPFPPVDSKSFLGWDYVFLEQGFLTQDTRTMDRIQRGMEIWMGKKWSFIFTHLYLKANTPLNYKCEQQSTVVLEPVTVTHRNPIFSYTSFADIKILLRFTA